MSTRRGMTIARCFAVGIFAATSFASAVLCAEGKAAVRDGQHDFDFDIGTWKTHSSRLLHPLSGSKEWIEMDGVTVVRPIWGGKGNIAELESDGPNGHLELLSLRLYDPTPGQWNLKFSTTNVAILNVAAYPPATPMIGR